MLRHLMRDAEVLAREASPHSTSPHLTSLASQNAAERIALARRGVRACKRGPD